MPKTHILRDGEPFEVGNKELFLYSCCDCGLTHQACIAKERNGNLGFAVRRDLEATQKKRYEKRDLLWGALLFFIVIFFFALLALEQDKLNTRIRQLELRSGMPDPWADKR